MIIFVTITGEWVIICTKFHIVMHQVSTKHTRAQTKGFKDNKRETASMEYAIQERRQMSIL